MAEQLHVEFLRAGYGMSDPDTITTDLNIRVNHERAGSGFPKKVDPKGVSEASHGE